MSLDGAAIVYCDGLFNTPSGKTAHGLVRFTQRYDVLCVIDAKHAGRDAREVLDGTPTGIPVVATLGEALERFQQATHFVIGLAPDGGRLPTDAWDVVREAIEAGLHVDSGLHDFISNDPEIDTLARAKRVKVRDIRKTPGREHLKSFTGRIAGVEALVVAMLGTDSAVGKRTTAWLLVHALEARGITAAMVGTGQTAWMQGAKHGIILDSLINDFIAGELENAVVSAWEDGRPKVIVVEGQGSLLNPAYPGGFEILAACRPKVVVLQHAPARVEYDGFPGFVIEPIGHQIHVLELVSGKKVVAITVNHEDLAPDQIDGACAALEHTTGLPTVDPLVHGMARVVDALVPFIV